MGGRKILNLLKENKELIIMVPTFALTFLGVLDGIIRYVYSLKAEQFYDVPKFYFYDNLRADYIMNMVFCMATIMIFFAPLMVKRFLKKNKLKIFESLCYSFFLAFLVFYLSLAFCVSFIINTLHIKGHDFSLLGACVVLSLVSWIVYFFVFRNDLKEYSNTDKQKTYDDKFGQKNSIKFLDMLRHPIKNTLYAIYAIKNTLLVIIRKPKMKEDIIAFAFAVVVTFSMIMTIWLIYHSTQFIPENKKKYEISEEMNTQCKIVVGYYKDLAIFMEGKINRSNEGSYLEIVKGEYSLESTKNIKLKYCRFDKIYCKNK